MPGSVHMNSNHVRSVPVLICMSWMVVFCAYFTVYGSLRKVWVIEKVLVPQRYVLSSLMTNSFLHSLFLLSSKQSLLPPTCQVSQHLACTGSGLDGTSAERSSRRTE